MSSPDNETSPSGVQNGVNSASEVTYTLTRAPDNDQLVVNVSIRALESVNRITLTLPDGATLEAVRKFEWTGGSQYTMTTTSAHLVYRVPFRQEEASGVTAVSRGEWAFIGDYEYYTPRIGIYGDNLDINLQRRIAGEGIGEDFAVFGPHRTVTLDDAESNITVVVPSAAISPRSAVYESLATADREFSVGGRPDQLRIYVAPDPIREGGLAEYWPGRIREIWVGDGARVYSGENVWLHELVHTRQDFQLRTDMRWFREASADYYAAYLTYRQDLISFYTFQQNVETMDEGSGILSDPDRWSADTPYEKGERVLAALDARIRNESNGTRSLEAVFRRMNEHRGSVNLSEFTTIVNDVAGTSLDGWINRYVTTADRPAVPDDEDAFEPPAPGLSDYAGPDGVIDTDDLRTMITDWARGEVSTELLRRGIRAWASEQAVD